MVVAGRRISLAGVAWALALAAAFLAGVSYLEHAWALLRFPFEVDPGEGFDVNGAVVLLAGGELYGDSTRFPFFALNYPPVYPLLLAPLVAIWGPSVVVGRALSVAAGLAVALLIGLAVRMPRPNRLPALLAGLGFLASAYAVHVMPLARVTSLMLLFGVAGLLALERGVESRTSSQRWMFIGVIFLIAGVYTKPVGLDAAVAGAAYLAWRRPPSWLFMLATGLVLGGGVHLGLNWSSAGRYFDSVYLANAFPWDFEQAFSYWRNFFETHGPLLILAAVGLIGHLLGRWPSVWLFYLAAGVATAATAGRWGAGESYFLPIIISCCVLGGRALAWGMPGALGGQIFGVSAFGLYVLTAGVGPWPLHNLIPGWDRGFQAQLSRNPTPADIPAGERIIAFVRGVSGPVLSEGAGYILAEGGTVIGNPMQIRGLYSHGLYDPGRLDQALTEHRIKGVILLGQWYPPETLGAIGDSYVQVDRVEVGLNTYLLLRPRAG
ncbi:MAG: hypothetical protein EXR58_00060 [Chloroflexi bacterium]|nr:hypothetical protein [Chloroflexota bacterium]